MKLSLQKFSFTAPLTALLISLMACQPTSTPNNSQSKTSGKTLPGQGITVRSAVNVQEEEFQTEIVNIALEKLGYQTKDIKQLDYSAIYVAIANKDLDFTAAHYIMSHIEFFDNAGGSDKLERLGNVVDPIIQGYQIDRKTAEEYNITNLEQLKDPKIAKLFDSDGDGKANFIGCNAGWRCEKLIEHQIDVYGLRDTVEQDAGNYFALIADAIVRYKQGESILFYTWTPLWLSSVLKEGQDVIWLEVPYTSFPGDLAKHTEKDTSVEGKNLGLLVDRQVVMANPEFLTAKVIFRNEYPSRLQ
ncbi:MAG: glycine betaine/L-proline ABC transporter substrate-binding protein ProX [Moorea sp. SIO2B7]|nr:glycine betaine/L-proline ABC transporter substrate-binding protein ProX [Moorena sp. SIO2B7]